MQISFCFLHLTFSMYFASYFLYFSILLSAFLQISFCFPAAYMQLVTPSEVAIAVRMLIAI